MIEHFLVFLLKFLVSVMQFSVCAFLQEVRCIGRVLLVFTYNPCYFNKYENVILCICITFIVTSQT